MSHDPKEIQSPCPPDLFERLQESFHQPESYNHLLAKTLDHVCQIVINGQINWVGGVPYSTDPLRGREISVNRVTLTSAYYGLNQSDRYLRIDGVTAAGSQGFLLPRKAIIAGLWAKSRSTGSWTIEARRNGSPITLASVVISSGFGSNDFIDVELIAGDFVQLFLSGTGVDHPIAAVEIAWRT